MLLVVNNRINWEELQRQSDDGSGSRHKSLLVMRLGNAFEGTKQVAGEMTLTDNIYSDEITKLVTVRLSTL
jgi:hypothetical protein